MEYLTSLPEYLNKIVKDTDFTEITDCKVNFHWGDQHELHRYLSVDQDDSFGQLLMSGTVETQYPLIWLVPGYRFSPYDVTEELYEFDNIKIVIVKRTDMEWLNKQRWKDNMHSLYALGETFKTTLKLDKDSEIVGNNYSWMESPTYSVIDENKSKTLDYCDALILEIRQLRINTECFKYLEQTC